MKSDGNELKKIRQKFEEFEEKQKERSFVSKLNMMFSVLISLTFFITNSLLVKINVTDFSTKVTFSFFSSLMVLLVFTLIGEFFAIIGNFNTLRYSFWITLLNGLFVLVIGMIFFTIYTYFPIELVTIIGFFATLPIYFFILFYALGIASLFDRYSKNFVKKPSFSNINFLIPQISGYLLLVIAFILSFTLSVPT